MRADKERLTVGEGYGRHRRGGAGRNRGWTGSVRGVVRVAHGLADASSARDLVPIGVRPLANCRELVRVPALRHTAASAASLATDLAGSGDVVGERCAERVGVVVGEVDLVVVPVERELERLSW